MTDHMERLRALNGSHGHIESIHWAIAEIERLRKLVIADTDLNMERWLNTEPAIQTKIVVRLIADLAMAKDEIAKLRG